MAVSAPHPARPRQSGVSLVEALMALAVMAFGMLALGGVQTTLRLNSDLSKQRSEATRIATEEIEGLRVFTTVAPQNGQVDWINLASRTVDPYVPPDGIGNTSYRVVRTVTPVAGTQQIIVRVQVQWTDRIGVQQTITLDSVIVGAAPVLSALISVPPTPSAVNLIDGRDPTIPRQSVPVDFNGRPSSAFKPQVSDPVVWIFDNATGEIVSICSGIATAQASITQADIDGATCPAIHGRLLAGTVRFDTSASPNSAAPAGAALPLAAASSPLYFHARSDAGGYSPVNQAGPPSCVVIDTPYSALAASTLNAVAYYCIVYPATAEGWGGQVNLQLADHYPNGVDTVAVADYKVYRYTQADTDNTRNVDHPKVYCMEKPGSANLGTPCTGGKVTGNLVNQNFLVVLQGAGALVSTRPHQDSLP
jgi:Tfp pilus assembly protein PilV